ncbi:hypothetical protein AB0F88_28550 [Streptosporangium sp. NPDC023963]|uniref:hypothetical protein n=1 Tax=Streptosporangium sp. NPDC023963 TaxID=3155608 RepID=UPI00342F4661
MFIGGVAAPARIAFPKKTGGGLAVVAAGVSRSRRRIAAPRAAATGMPASPGRAAGRPGRQDPPGGRDEGLATTGRAPCHPGPIMLRHLAARGAPGTVPPVISGTI